MSSFQNGVGATELCKEADKLLAAGDLGRATALFTTAFGGHAGSTVAHMRALDKSRLPEVISTLEAWLDGHGAGQDPAEAPNKGLVAVFLSTLCPNNISASVYKMESVLQGGGQSSDEVFARCSALLEGKRTPRPEGPTRLILELTRALACVLSDAHDPRSLQLYLKAFQDNRSETVRLVKGRQPQHIPRIVSVFFEQVSQWCPILYTQAKSANGTNFRPDIGEMISSGFVEFLLAISPDNSLVREIQAAFLYSTERFEDSAEAFSLALQVGESPTDKQVVENQTVKAMPLARRASILTGRAAALFSAGGRAGDMCKDLGEAFAVHPATARHQFQKLFSNKRTRAAVCMQLRQQADRGLSSFRETALARQDLRSSEGLELLDPVIAQLRTLCHLEPDGGGRELRVRLADCLLLRGEFREALSICSQLAAAATAQQSYQNTVQVLHGYARLLTEDHKGALEDFQAVIEHSAPHPASCVRALCGRGLLRMMAGSRYLTALDYVTACRLQPQDTAFTVRCLVPWNCRGLLCTVLQEQGRAMLEEAGEQRSISHSASPKAHQHNNHLSTRPGREGCATSKENVPVGVHALAALLMELQPGADAPVILSADALYQSERVEEAYRLLLSVEAGSPRSPLVARLALLQLHRGFLYDANQLLKKLIQCGETSCLRPLFAVAPPEDRGLLRSHCHAASKRILGGRGEEDALREAVAYLSVAIMASGPGGEATDSLLERARCYALLGQRKTAVFDFTAILKEQSDHIPALCGRGFTYLTLNQQKESTQDILAALQIDTEEVTRSILSLKERARKLICDWLQQYCRSALSDILAANPVPCEEESLREAFLICGVLMRSDSREARWHLLYVDILLAKGDARGAGAHLQQVFGREPREAMAHARWGVVEAWQQRPRAAARCLSGVAEKEASVLELLLALVPPPHKQSLAQAASQDASSASEAGQQEQALALLTVAVRAAGEGQTQYLRQRAACLAQLGLHQRAVSDLDLVLRHRHATDGRGEPETWAEDLCRRGASLLLCSQEEAALRDFSRALELQPDRALRCVLAGPGRQSLAESFLRSALGSYGERRLREAWSLTESGLRVEPNHAALRRLRARIKREAANPTCILN